MEYYGLFNIMGIIIFFLKNFFIFLFRIKMDFFRIIEFNFFNYLNRRKLERVFGLMLI